MDSRNRRERTALTTLFSDAGMYSKYYDEADVDLLSQLLTLFVEYGGDMNTVDAKGNNLLMRWISNNGCVSIVKKLLECGADVSTMKNHNGYTVLSSLIERLDSFEDGCVSDSEIEELDYVNEVRILCMGYESNRQGQISKPLLK